MVETEADAMAVADGSAGNKIISAEAREELALTSESLAQTYPQYTSSLLNLIKNSEHKMNR